MQIIQFKKKDFIEADGFFWFKTTFKNAPDHLVSVMRVEDDGSMTTLVKETKVDDDIIAVSVSNRNLAFNGKILIK